MLYSAPEYVQTQLHRAIVYRIIIYGRIVFVSLVLNISICLQCNCMVMDLSCSVLILVGSMVLDIRILS